MRQVISVAFASLLFGLLAACGGDELSRDEFVAQANEICQLGNDELNENFEALFFSQLSAEPTEEEFEQVIVENGQTLLDDFVSNVRGQIADIRDLNGPSDFEDEVEPVLDEASEIVDRISDTSPEEFFGSDGDEFAALDPKLDALGLTTCAE